MMEDFLDAVEDAKADDSTRLLVFTGAGRAFSAGDDIVDGMGERTRGGNPGGVNADRGIHHQLVKALLELPKPVVAALNGRCHGAGFVLSLACDFRVGHTDTLIGDIRSARAIFAPGHTAAAATPGRPIARHGPWEDRSRDPRH